VNKRVVSKGDDNLDDSIKDMIEFPNGEKSKDFLEKFIGKQT
jgi:hypothetical protein